MLKVYLNDEPKIIGVKFDDFRHTQVRISVIGKAEKGATVYFVPYDRDVHGDFNEDPKYRKDYDYDMVEIFRALLNIREHDTNFSFEHVPYVGGAAVRVMEDDDGAVKGVEALSNRLEAMLGCFNRI